jgi:hypothetical protein
MSLWHMHEARETAYSAKFLIGKKDKMHRFYNKAYIFHNRRFTKGRNSTDFLFCIFYIFWLFKIYKMDWLLCLNVQLKINWRLIYAK